MTFAGRLKFYGFGFGLGLLIVWTMFGTRSCTTPNEMKMQELVIQQLQLSEKAQCKLKCLHLNKKQLESLRNLSPEQQLLLKERLELIFKIELRHFEVNYDASAPRKEPCGEYFLQPKKEFAAEHPYQMLTLDCDSITRIEDIAITSAAISCTCQ